MTKTENEQARCRFPVASDRTCGRPTAPAAVDPDGRGRPSGYCDKPEHNRAAAWRARRTFESARTGVEEPAEVVARPVTSAGEKVAGFLDEARALTEKLASTQADLLQQLSALSDPDAAAVELQTVTADAAKDIKAAEARAARAEQARLENQALVEEANAAADDMDQAAQRAEAQLVDVREELAEVERSLAAVEAQNAEQDQALIEARAANATQLTEIERLADELATESLQSETIRQANDELTEINEQLKTDLTRAQEEVRHLVDQLDAVTRERDEQRRRAEAADTKAERAHGELTELRSQLADVRLELREATGAVADVRAERAGLLAQLESAKDTIQAEQHHANQRLADQRGLYEAQLTEQRETIAALRQPRK